MSTSQSDFLIDPLIFLNKIRLKTREKKTEKTESTIHKDPSKKRHVFPQIIIKKWP